MTRPRSVEQIVEQQAFRAFPPVAPATLAFRPSIALSQLPGSRGHDLALRLCDDLRYALFDREIVHEIATRAHVSERVVRSLDEHRRSALEEFVEWALAPPALTSFGYFQHLAHVVRSIGRHGGAVIVGHGAHLLLAPGEALRVLVDASGEARAATLARQERLGLAVARARLAQAEEERRAFLRRYFQADADDRGAFDLVVNTSTLGVDASAAAIESALCALAPAVRRDRVAAGAAEGSASAARGMGQAYW